MIHIAITPGENAGIGPDITLDCSQKHYPAALTIVADKQLLAQRAKECGVDVQLIDYTPSQIKPHQPGSLVVLDTPSLAKTQTGVLNVDNAQYIINCLTRAVSGCLHDEFSGLVTGPVQKSIINQAGIPFSGHTEFLAKLAAVNKVVMMLASPSMRVALVTTHLPLAKVPAAITKENLQRTLSILHHSLTEEFNISQPKILVAGLNPHAGEAGHLGSEEIEIIEPVLNQFRQIGCDVVGPLPADTLFLEKHLKQADAILCMYHDQGLPVLKYSGFEQAINVTLGLPFIRTSVDHGPALELAGKNLASSTSLDAAINEAIKLACNRNLPEPA